MQAFSAVFRAAEDAIIRGWNTGLPEESFGDDFIQGQSMAKRTGTGVRDPGHFQHSGDMGVAAVALDAVRHVEDHSGGVLLWIGWHKCLQCCKQALVSFTD